MRKRCVKTLAFFGGPVLFATCAIAGSTGADRLRRTFIVLFLIASIGCSDDSPVAPSPVAEIGATYTNVAAALEPTASGATFTNVAAALEPTASGATFTNVAAALEPPVRRATHHTTGWTFNLLNDSAYDEHLNKYRRVDFSTPETGDIKLEISILTSQYAEI